MQAVAVFQLDSRAQMQAMDDAPSAAPQAPAFTGGSRPSTAARAPSKPATKSAKPAARAASAPRLPAKAAAPAPSATPAGGGDDWETF